MTTLLLSCDGGCLWWMLLLEIGKQNNCIMLYMYDHIFINSYQKICKTFVRMTMSSIVTQILLVSFRRDSSQKEFMPRISLDLVNMHQTNDETDSVRAKFYTLLPRTGACTSIWSTWLAARWLAFCISSGHSRRNLNMFFLFGKTFGHDTICVLICKILQELIYLQSLAMSCPAVCWSAKPVQNIKIVQTTRAL